MTAREEIPQHPVAFVSRRAWAWWATQQLEAVGADAPRRIAECILERALGLERPQLYASWNELVPRDAFPLLEAMLVRALQRQPLAYVIGEKEFWGLEFEVSPAVLVPRPETELLVEWALRLFPAGRRGAPISLVDAGTGSGCLAVALAREWPQARVTAMDRSLPALQLARRNARRWGVEGRIRFVCSNWLTSLAARQFPLIVANPPYLTEEELASAEPEVKFEPALALAGGKDGLEAIRTVLADAARCSTPGGWLLLEIGAEQGSAAAELARAAGAREVAVEQDLAGWPRVLRARW